VNKDYQKNSTANKTALCKTHTSATPHWNGQSMLTLTLAPNPNPNIHKSIYPPNVTERFIYLDYKQINKQTTVKQYSSQKWRRQ